MAVKQHSTLTLAITAAIESAINAALRYDPGSKRIISQLNDILAIDIVFTNMPTMTLFCQGTTHGIRVTSHCELEVTTRLRGKPIALVGLLDNPHSLANSGVELSGDIKLLQRWQAVLNNLDIDWEACLQEHLGDMAGPVAATVIGKTGRWLQRQWRYHQRQLSVYLQEELRVVPTKPEFDDFHQQVDELMLATDRVQARVQQLHAVLQSSRSNTDLENACSSDGLATDSLENDNLNHKRN